MSAYYQGFNHPSPPTLSDKLSFHWEPLNQAVNRGQLRGFDFAIHT